MFNTRDILSATDAICDSGKKMMKARAGAVAFALFILASGTASAQNEFLSVVRGQLLESADYFIDQGYEPTHEPFTGQLYEYGEDSREATLYAGVSYAITAACDQDCWDVDLELYDGAGRLVGSDIERDGNPLIVVTPRRTGRFTIVVSMPGCSAEPCFYGVGIFGE